MASLEIVGWVTFPPQPISCQAVSRSAWPSRGPINQPSILLRLPKRETRAQYRSQGIPALTRREASGHRDYAREDIAEYGPANPFPRGE